MLKYLVLTTMLMDSDINPFDSPETKAYQNDPRISAMTDLVDAYQRDDINKYESVLAKSKDVTADPFITENIDEVTRSMRTKGVLKLVAPYTRFTFQFVAKQLQISIGEVQDIIGFLILDKKLKAKIDQTRGTVEVDSENDVDRLHAVQQWSTSINSLWTTILNNSEGFRADESSQGLDGLGGQGLSWDTPKPTFGMNGFSGPRPPKKNLATRKASVGP